jgi:hypothetical protein
MNGSSEMDAHGGEHAAARTAMRIDAVQIVASLAHGAPSVLHSLFRESHVCAGSNEALEALLVYKAPYALLDALERLKPADPPALQSALARAFRVLTSAIADVAGPSDGNLLPESVSCRGAAQEALGHLFEVWCSPGSHDVDC